MTPHSPSAGEESALDRLLLQQTLENHRASSASFSSTETTFIVVLVTLLGFAIERQSWGLAVVSAMVYPILGLRLRGYLDASDKLLSAAADVERRLRGEEVALSGVIQSMRAALKWLDHVLAVIIVVAITHVAIALGLIAWADGWSFTGG